jgi:hypothetical protein
MRSGSALPARAALSFNRHLRYFELSPGPIAIRIIIAALNNRERMQ